MDINFKKELTYQLVCKVEKKCKNLVPNHVFSFKVDRKFKEKTTAEYIKNVLQFFGLNAVVDMALHNQRKNITVYGQLADGNHEPCIENIIKTNRWLNSVNKPIAKDDKELIKYAIDNARMEKELKRKLIKAEKLAS